MRRVLIMTGLCMGLLLMGLAAGLMLQRRGGSSPEVVLLSVTQNGKMQLWAVLRQGNHETWRRLSPPGLDSLQLWIVSPDGQWLYFQVKLPGTGYRFAWLNPATLHFEYLPPHILPSVWAWSPDGQWMYFNSIDARGRSSIFRATPDGNQLQDLTPQFDATRNPTFPSYPLIIAEQDWVVFGGFGPQSALYHVDTTSGQMTQLSDGVTVTHLRTHIHNADGDWLVVEKSDGLYRMRLDGSALTPLLPQEPHGSTWYGFWPAARLMLFEYYLTSGNLYAISMDDFSVQWSLPDKLLPQPPFTGTFVLGQSADGWVYTLAADGTITRMVELYTNGPTYDLSPDEQWVVVSMGGRLFTVSVQDGQRRDLYQGTGYLYVLKWAEDGQSLYIDEDDGTRKAIWRVWLADGHRQLLVSQTTGQFLGTGRLANPAFNGLTLIGGGGLLVTGTLVGLKRRGKANQ